MSGRYLNVGEKSVYDIIDYDGMYSRMSTGQICNVDNKNGYVKINYEGYVAGGISATIPPLWMSFPRNGRSSWGRYIPQEGDIVKIGYSSDNSARIIGYDILAGEDKDKDGKSDRSSTSNRVGWAQLNRLHEQAKANPDLSLSDDSASIAKFSLFKPLLPGEYDFMSSGGAYIFGGDDGKLYLESGSGSVSISLIKDDMLIYSASSLRKHVSGKCEYRFGQVRRPDTTGADSLLASDTTGSYKEFNVSINSSTANIASIQIGNVADEFGLDLEKMSSTGQNVTCSIKTYNMVGSKVFNMSVDVMGNCIVEGSDSATSGITLNYLQAATINSNSIKLQSISSPAIHPLILSNIYRENEDILIRGLSAQITSLASAIQSIALAMQTGGAAAAVPISGAMAMGAIFSAAAPAITTLAGNVAANTPTLASSFTGAANSYLSKVSKTG